MLADRQHGIFGTAWRKSAVRPDQGADEITIGPDQEEEDAFHESPPQGFVINESSSARSFFSMTLPSTGAVIRTTQSLPCKRSCCDLNHSLRMRLSLFRSTDRDKIRFGTISPSRARADSPERIITLEQRPRMDRPSLMALVKSAPVRESRKSFGLAGTNRLKTWGSVCSDGQTGTTFGPACTDYCPATSGLHPLQKAVRPLPADY